MKLMSDSIYHMNTKTFYNQAYI